MAPLRQPDAIVTRHWRRAPTCKERGRGRGGGVGEGTERDNTESETRIDTDTATATDRKTHAQRDTHTHTRTHTRESFDVRAGGWRRASKAGVERWRIDAGCMLAAANHKKQCNVSGIIVVVVIIVINAIIIIFIIIIITYSTIRINLSIY